MNKNNVIELERRVKSAVPLTELLRSGAKQLLAQAVESEVQELLAKHQDRRTESGHAGVVRNGYLPERELQTRLGSVTQARCCGVMVVGRYPQNVLGG